MCGGVHRIDWNTKETHFIDIQSTWVGEKNELQTRACAFSFPFLSKQNVSFPLVTRRQSANMPSKPKRSWSVCHYWNTWANSICAHHSSYTSQTIFTFPPTLEKQSKAKMLIENRSKLRHLTEFFLEIRFVYWNLLRLSFKQKALQLLFRARYESSGISDSHSGHRSRAAVEVNSYCLVLI